MGTRIFSEATSAVAGDTVTAMWSFDLRLVGLLLNVMYSPTDTHHTDEAGGQEEHDQPEASLPDAT